MKNQQIKQKNENRKPFTFHHSSFIFSLLSFLLLLFILPLSSFAQTTTKGFQWIRHHGDEIPFNPEKVEDIQTDRWGNIYVAGQVNDLFVRDSSGTIIKSQRISVLDSLYNHGGLDSWLAKYDPQGNLLWHRYIGSGSDDVYSDMVTDLDGNCYIAGEMKYHNLRPASTVGRVVLANNELGTFIAKVDQNGNLLWHKPFGGDTISNVFIEYPANVKSLKLTDDGTLSAFIIGGGADSRGYQLLFDRDSLVKSYHEATFDLNGNYLGVKTFPFPRYDRLPNVQSIQANDNGYFITGILDRDTVFVGNDTVLKVNFDNAIHISFDSNLNHVHTFRTENNFDQFLSSKVIGDTVLVTGHFNVSTNTSVAFDTINYGGNPNASQEGGMFIFNSVGTLLGLYTAKSVGMHKQTITEAYIDGNSFGIAGAFTGEMSYSGTTNYIEAVDNCASCTNIDLFFALLDRNGNLIAEDVIYTSGFQTDAVFAMHRKDSMLYIGGFVGDSVIIPGVDTFITRGSNDAFIAAYNVGLVTSLEEPANYIKADNSILAYPNPTQGQVTLMGKALNNQAQLFSIWGQLVRTYRLDENAFQQQISLDNLDSGIYFLVIVGESEKQQVKIVKQ